MSSILEKAKELSKIWRGYWSARVLLTANNYRIFDYLTKPKSAKTISKKLNTDLRATEILLDALTGLNILKKRDGRYSNSSASAKFLVTGSPYYQGNILRHANALWQNWSGLDEVIKTGKPYRKVFDQKSFILGMHNIASLKAKNIIKTIDLKGVRATLDLGGGPGTYSVEMAKKGVNVALFDFPETIKVAKRVIGKEKVKGINFIEGDFMTDDIGRGYDLIFVSQILHAYSEKDNFKLIQKCKEALNNNGRLVVQEFYLLKDRSHPVQSALFSINMLVNTEGGRSYSSDEIKKWLLKAGLKDVKEKLMDEAVLISGYRRRNI